jgi:L-ascorbate 6-phosphate lactonase
VTYVIETEHGTLLHAGDSKPADTLARIGERYEVDLGILAFGSTGNLPDSTTGEPRLTKWYADADEVIDLANQFEVDRLLPSHHDMWKGMTADPKALHDHVRNRPFPKRLEIVEIGDRITL